MTQRCPDFYVSDLHDPETCAACKELVLKGLLPLSINFVQTNNPCCGPNGCGSQPTAEAPTLKALKDTTDGKD